MINLRVSFQTNHGVGEGSFYLSCQRIRLRHGIIHALEYRERLHVFERVNDLGTRKRPETCHVYGSNLDPHMLPNPIHRDFGCIDERAHADNGVFSVIHPIRFNDFIGTTGQLCIIVHRTFDRVQHTIIIKTLSNFTLHVAVLILDHTRHDRIVGIKKIVQRISRISYEIFHQLFFRQQNVFHRMCRQKTVLNVKKWRRTFFSRSSSDQSEIGSALRISGEQHAPSHIFDSHHVVMTGMHIEALAGQRPCPDVKNHRKSLAADRIQDFFHQNETLTGREIRYPASCQCKSLTNSGGAVFALGLEKLQSLSPKVGFSVHN